MRKAPLYFRKRRTKLLILTAMLFLILVGASACQYYQQQEERNIINILKEEGVWYSYDNYELIASVDVDSISTPTGNWVYKTANVTYELKDELLRLHYTLNSTTIPKVCIPSSVCAYAQHILLVVTNSMTTPSRGNRDNPHWEYWGPTNGVSFLRSYQADWQVSNAYFVPHTTSTGQHIHWHLYLYLVTSTQ